MPEVGCRTHGRMSACATSHAYPTRRLAGRGFTLVELLVVIAILSILAMLLLPVLSEAVLQARLVSCMHNNRQLYTALVGYKDDHADQIPPWHGGGDGNMNYLYAYRWFWSPKIRMGWGGYLFRTGMLDSSAVRLFECPDTEGTNRSNIRSGFNRLYTIPPTQWQQSLNTSAWGHYSLYAYGRFGNIASSRRIMLCETVVTFCRPEGEGDPEGSHGRILRKHGDWPYNLDPYQPKGHHYVGPGPATTGPVGGSGPCSTRCCRTSETEGLSMDDTERMRILRQGFTLVELLVVIAVISLLVAMLMPSLRHAVKLARRTSCLSDCKQNYTGILTFCDDNKGDMPAVAVLHWATHQWVAERAGNCSAGLAPTARAGAARDFCLTKRRATA